MFNPTPLDFLVIDSEPEYIVSPLIVRDGITVIHGDPSAGKSWLAQSLVAASVTGRDSWLGLPLRAKGGLRALVFDEENMARDVRKRLGALGFSPQAEAERARLRYFSRTGLILYGHDEMTRWMHRQAASFKPDLVVFDTIASTGGIDPNDNARILSLIATVIRPLFALADCAVVLLHHDRKPPPGERARPGAHNMLGGIEWRGQVESQLSLGGSEEHPPTRAPNDRWMWRTEMQARHTKNRLGAKLYRDHPFPIYLDSLHADDEPRTLITASLAAEPPPEDDRSKLEDMIAVLAEHITNEPIPRAELMDRLSIKRHSADERLLTRALQHGERQGRWYKVGRGRYATADMRTTPV